MNKDTELKKTSLNAQDLACLLLTTKPLSYERGKEKWEEIKNLVRGLLPNAKCIDEFNKVLSEL